MSEEKETNSDWSSEELAALRETTKRLLRTDTDFGYMTSALIASRRLYSAATAALSRFVAAEGLSADVERFVLLAMSAESERPYQVDKLRQQLLGGVALFLRDEEAYQASAKATVRRRSKQLPDGGVIQIPLFDRSLVQARPGEVHAFLGPGETVHAHMQDMLARSPLGLLDSAGQPLDGSRVARLYHGLAEANGAYSMPLEQWLEAASTKRKLTLFLAKLSKLLKVQRDILGLSNLIMLTGQPKKETLAARTSLVTGAVTAIIRNAVETGRLYIFGIYALAEETDVLAESLSVLTTRGLTLHLAPCVT